MNEGHGVKSWQPFCAGALIRFYNLLRYVSDEIVSESNSPPYSAGRSVPVSTSMQALSANLILYKMYGYGSLFKPFDYWQHD